MSSYKYYDYLKKYNSHFVNRYENWSHLSWGRKSNYLQLLNLRAYTLMTQRSILLPGMKLKAPFFMLGCMVCLADIWGMWFFFTVYNKYSPQKWVFYQPYLKGDMTLMEYYIIIKYLGICTSTTLQRKKSHLLG